MKPCLQQERGEARPQRELVLQTRVVKKKKLRTTTPKTWVERKGEEENPSGKSISKEDYQGGKKQKKQ